MNDQPDETPDEQPEDHEGHQHMYMGPHGLMTQAQYEELMDNQHAHYEASAHSAVRFFDELTEEQLITFRGIMKALAALPEAGVTYYEAMASATLKYRFGICPACFKKHNDELQNMVETGKAEMALTPEDEEELRSNAEVWNVTFMDAGDGRPLSLQPVSCKAECGAFWTNLGDRMLRKPGPDGCDGCIYKMKNG